MRRDGGFVLVWGLLLLLLVGAASSTFFLRSSTLAKEAATDRLKARAFWAAEGGLTRCRHALAGDPSFPGEDVEIGGIPTRSRVLPTERGWRVVVTANPGGARIVADLERAPFGR